MADRGPDDQTFLDDIEGYFGRLSYAPGETAQLHVSTRAERYDVVVERWGAERQRVWSATDLPGSYSAPPADADSRGCRWPVSLEIPIVDSWHSGFHLVTLTAPDAPAGRDIAHACFVVRRSPSVAPNPVLLVVETNTWNAYNTWGGKSLYTGGHRVSFARPFGRGILCRDEVDRDDRKARPRRWSEESDTDGLRFQQYRTDNDYPAAIGSTGWFSHTRRFVEWAERAGLEFDYAVSSDLEDNPGVVDGHSTIVCVGHDEYWSAPQRDTVERFVAGGGNLATFSGNTMFWQVRLEHDDAGTHMVCHKYKAHEDDPVVADPATAATMSGMWADPVVDRPEWTVLGAGSAFGLYHRFGKATTNGVGGFIVYRDDHWMFAGTDLGYGDVIGADDGVVGYETLGCPMTLDEFHLPVAATRPETAGPRALPDELEIVAYVPSSNLGVGEYPKSISALSDQGDLEFVADRIFGGADSPDARRKARNGNAVMLVCRPWPDGGEVVTVGTTDWVFGLATDAAVQKVTSNVLARLGR